METKLNEARPIKAKSQDVRTKLLYALCNITFCSAFVIPYIKSIESGKTK